MSAVEHLQLQAGMPHAGTVVTVFDQEQQDIGIEISIPEHQHAYIVDKQLPLVPMKHEREKHHYKHEINKQDKEAAEGQPHKGKFFLDRFLLMKQVCEIDHRPDKLLKPEQVDDIKYGNLSLEHT